MDANSNPDIPKEVKSLFHDVQDHSLRLTPHPTPTPSVTQYVVQVHAVGITNGELLWPEPNALAFPIPGYDVAATVLKSPSTKSRFQPGNEVYALTAFDRPANAREVSVIEETEIASMPKGMSFTDAAAVPMSALTARMALFDKGGFVEEENSLKNKDRSILVIAASGAVGIWAIQLARWAGIGRVVGMCGTHNVEFAKSLGADEVIDHRETSIRDWIANRDEDSKFDLVIDGVGGETLKEAWTAVKSDGVLLCIVQPVDGSRPASGVSDRVKGSFFIVHPDSTQLEKITVLIEAGKLRPFVDSVYRLDNFQEAFARAKSGRARGKVILEVRTAQ